MALICDIRVNMLGIGRIIMVRESGAVGEMNTYRVSAFTMPHPLTGEEVDVKEVRVQHHYNDSPLDLIEKSIAAVKAAL